VPTRTQLTLFVPPAAAGEIEGVRALLDPVQARLIAAHITLCREDELAMADFANIKARLAAPHLKPFVLRFGRPQPFYEHGVLLPCVEGDEAFHALRHWVLASTTVRRHLPHITLAHPRNPKAPNNTPANAALLPENLRISFPAVCRIEQTDSAPWKVIEQFVLGDPAAS
jgi:hypothetical protein